MYMEEEGIITGISDGFGPPDFLFHAMRAKDISNAEAMLGSSIGLRPTLLPTCHLNPYIRDQRPDTRQDQHQTRPTPDKTRPTPRQRARLNTNQGGTVQQGSGS